MAPDGDGHVFVTVGTTRFDALVDAVCHPKVRLPPCTTEREGPPLNPLCWSLPSLWHPPRPTMIGPRRCSMP